MTHKKNIMITLLPAILFLFLVSGCSWHNQQKTAMKTKPGISRDAVAKVIISNIEDITKCYEDALVKKPDVKGKIVFKWTIMLDGSVDNVSVKSSNLNDKELVAPCILDAIGQWQFPIPAGGTVVVSYPFVFDVSGF